MPLCLRILLTVLTFVTEAHPTPLLAQATHCSGYDSQVWAQSVFETDPGHYAALDPDGNGLACEDLPVGAALASWTSEVPAGAEPVQLARVVTGDTIQVTMDGIEEPVRLLLIDSPEANDPTIPSECYGAEAYYFLNWLLSLGDKLYLERDVSDRDDVDHLLRYAWLDFGDGEVYLVNEAMVRSGYAAPSTFPPDVQYEEEIRAARFAREHEYGIWSWCVADDEGDTNELVLTEPESVGPESESIDEEPVPSELAPGTGHH